MKILTLTDKQSQKMIDVNVSQIKMLEDDGSGGTHVIFGGDLGRIVVESKDKIYALLGVMPVKIS